MNNTTLQLLRENNLSIKFHNWEKFEPDIVVFEGDTYPNFSCWYLVCFYDDLDMKIYELIQQMKSYVENVRKANPDFDIIENKIGGFYVLEKKNDRIYGSSPTLYKFHKYLKYITNYKYKININLLKGITTYE